MAAVGGLQQHARRARRAPFLTPLSLQYLFDLRNASVLEWLAGPYILSDTGLGSPSVHGFYFDVRAAARCPVVVWRGELALTTRTLTLRWCC